MTSNMDLIPPEYRKGSKVKLALLVLLVIAGIIIIVLAALYAKEKGEDSRSPTENTQSPTENTRSPTENTQSPTENTRSPTEEKQNPSCLSPSCVTSAADILERLDASVNPCDDFYQYSCGGFIQKKFIRDDLSYLDSFATMRETMEYELESLLEREELSSYSEDSAMYKALHFYNSCINEEQIKSTGTHPLVTHLETYNSCPLLSQTWDSDNWSLEKVLARTLVNTGEGIFVNVDISPSIIDTSRVVISIQKGSYFNGFVNTRSSISPEQTLLEYKHYMTAVFELLGANALTAMVDVDDIFAMVKSFYQTKGDIFDTFSPEVEYMTLQQLNSLTYAEFDWVTYLSEVLGDPNLPFNTDQKFLVILPDYVKNAVTFLTNERKSVVANAMMWRVIEMFITALPEEFQDALSKYTEMTSGVKTVKPRSKICSLLTNEQFSYVTALLYSNVYFSEEARLRALDLFTEIKTEFTNGLAEQTWMDDETRKAARLKLDFMKINVGFPSFIKSPQKLNAFYEKFQVAPDNFFQNVLNALRAGFKRKLDQLGKPPKLEQFPTPPVGVNAFYRATSNGITVLLGILKPPFYEHNRLRALNYGGIGMSIGHEITHGFDMSGSRFDEKGNLRGWWTDDSKLYFYKRSECLWHQYNNTYIFGRKVDGLRTLSENIADNGGLKYAYRAYEKWRDQHGKEEKLPGLTFTNDQLFFIGFAQAWCSKYREDVIDSLMMDAHALDPVRVRVPLYNFPAFSKAFSCKKPSDTCTVW